MTQSAEGKRIEDKGFEFIIQFNNYVINHPEFRGQLPDGEFILCLRDPEDEAFNHRQWEQANKAYEREQGRLPIVVVTMKLHVEAEIPTMI